jgi:hypothetical protein
MPDKASRTVSVTPASERAQSVDSIEGSIDTLDEYDEFDDSPENRVRFKVRGFLRVNKFLIFLIIGGVFVHYSVS